MGLAAPQIGISRRLAVIDVTFQGRSGRQAGELQILKDCPHRRPRTPRIEGLSEYSGVSRAGSRARKVTIRAQDVNGKWFEKDRRKICWPAHSSTKPSSLNGKLRISHLSVLKRDFMKRKIRKLMKAGEW